MDFADVRAIMANAGSSLMGIGIATGNPLILKLLVMRMIRTPEIIFNKIRILTIRKSSSLMYMPTTLWCTSGSLCTFDFPDISNKCIMVLLKIPTMSSNINVVVHAFE